MTIAFNVLHFSGHYYLFIREGGRTLGVSLIHLGICPGCGHTYLSVPPCEQVPDLALQLAELRRSTASIMTRVGEPVGLFVCGEAGAACPGCGQALSLPVPELLDADRTPFGRYAMWKPADHDSTA